MKRGQLASQSGCNGETIRYYEKIGLLAPSRSAAGHRIYSESDRARLGFILRARALGFSIVELRGLLDLADSPNMTCGEVEAIARHHLEQIRNKIADLRRLEATLADTLKLCSGGNTPDCAVIDALLRPSAGA